MICDTACMLCVNLLEDMQALWNSPPPPGGRATQFANAVRNLTRLTNT